jgi:hypothetical protein
METSSSNNFIKKFLGYGSGLSFWAKVALYFEENND